MLFYCFFFAIITLFKNCFNKFIDCIFPSVKNNWLAKSIINTNNFVSNTAKNMILIFFSIWSVFISVITFNSFYITFKVSINFNRTANCLKWFLNLIETLFNFTLSLPFLFKQFSLYFCKIFTLQCKQYLHKYFLVLHFVLLHINPNKF